MKKFIRLKNECFVCKIILDWEGDISAVQLSSLFASGNKVAFETFEKWIAKNGEVISYFFTVWL